MTSEPLQSVAFRAVLKVYVTADQSEGTGKTVAITISKNGAAFGNPSIGATNATEIGNGWYYVDLSTTDTGTLGPLVVRGVATGCDPAERTLTVVKATNKGMTGIPDAVTNTNGGLPILSSSGTTLAYILSTVTALTNAPTANATELAIKAKTDNLPADPADASDLLALFDGLDLVISTIPGEVNTELSNAHGAGSWEGGSGGSGSGAYAITATVTDGVNPLQNVVVRLTQGVNSFTNTTNVSGQSAFSLDAGSYVVSLAKGGYQFTPVSRTVTGNNAGTIENDLVMAATVIPAPTNPELTTAYLDAYDGKMELSPSIQFTFQLVTPPNGLTAESHVSEFTVYSDAVGRVEVSLLKASGYRAKRSSGAWVSFTTDNGNSFALPVTLGRP